MLKKPEWVKRPLELMTSYEKSSHLLLFIQHIYIHMFSIHNITENFIGLKCIDTRPARICAGNIAKTVFKNGKCLNTAEVFKKSSKSRIALKNC